MPSRRQHTKTRHGCAPCKSRKKRCGLEKPICQNCTRIGSECSYPNQAPDAGQPWYIGDNTLSSSSSSSSNSPPWLLEGQAAGPTPSLTTVDFKALELMHQYTALTCFTMTENSEHLHIWQILIPRLSFSYPYLLHGLLSLSALHRQHDAKPPEQPLLINHARKNQQLALSMYIQHLDDINEKNCHAMFIYSMILGGICFAFIRVPENESPEENIIDMVIAAFNTLMGATLVAIRGREWLHNGEFKPLLTPLATYDECIARLSASSRAAIGTLRLALPPLMSPGSSLSEEDHTAYDTAIQALAVAFPYADGRLSSLTDVMSWPVAAGSAYLELLKDRQDLALVILAYYGVALHYSNRVWFLQGIGAKLVNAIAEQVGEQWEPLIHWTKEQVSPDAQQG